MLPANRKRGTAQFTHTPNRTNWKLSLWKVICHTILHRPQAGLLPWCLRLLSYLCALVTCVLFAGFFSPLVFVSVFTVFVVSTSFFSFFFFLVFFSPLLCHNRVSGDNRGPSFLFPKAPQRAEAVSVAFSPWRFQKLGEVKPEKGITGSQFTALPSLVCTTPPQPPKKRAHLPKW